MTAKWHAFLKTAEVGDTFWLETSDPRNMMPKIASRAARLGMKLEQRACIAVSSRKPYEACQLVRIHVVAKKATS